MKTTALALVCMLSTILVNAQVEKGSIFLGGSIGFNSFRLTGLPPGESKSSILSVYPQIGKAIGTNKVLGLQLFFSNNPVETTYTNTGTLYKSRLTTYGAGVFYRQYVPLYKKWFVYGSSTLGVNITTGNSHNLGVKVDKTSGYALNAGIGLGLTYQAGKKIWLEAGLGDVLNVNYNHQKKEYLDATGQVVGTEKTAVFNASANAFTSSNVTVGVRWIFPKS